MKSVGNAVSHARQVEELSMQIDTMNIVLATWAPFHAGAEVAAVRLATGLRDAGHLVTVVVGTDGETRGRLEAAGVDVRWIPLALTDKLGWWRYKSAQRKLRQVLIEAQPDVVHANDLPTSQMIAQASGQLGIPRVCHHRWLFEGEAIDWLNKFGAERHIFVSEPFMNEMCGNSAKLRGSSRVMIHDCVPIPVEPSDADRSEARRRLGLSLNKQLVLFAGQMTERKGIADLLHAWQMLPAEVAANSDLCLIGDDLEHNGVYRHEMEKLAAQLGVNARFFGYRSDVFEWIVASDICVVPSHVEPFGLAVLEGMAHCRPVIGARVGGIPSMIVDGESGILVSSGAPRELAEALARLLGDRKLQREFGQAARCRCEDRFSQSAHVGAIVDQYRQVVEDHARVSA